MASIVVAVGGKIADLLEKEEMKKRDEEMEEERRRERDEESEKEADRALKLGINHFKHDHPLNELHTTAEAFVCGGCNRTGRGRRYRCEDAVGCAGFEMHSVCASSPVMLVGDFQSETSEASSMAVQTLDTFAHRGQGHLVKEVYKHGDKYQCGHCLANGEGVRFRCDECNFNLHPICAKSPTRLSSFMHPEHELDLITRPIFADCAICGHGRELYNRVYACQQCEFYLHPTCSQWPQYLFHELHPIVHPLQFEILSSSSSSQRKKCSACKKKCKASLYHCKSCDDESFHPECLLRFSLSGSAVPVRRRDRFKKEVAKHSIFHAVFIGAEKAAHAIYHAAFS